MVDQQAARIRSLAGRVDELEAVLAERQSGEAVGLGDAGTSDGAAATPPRVARGHDRSARSESNAVPRMDSAGGGGGGDDQGNKDDGARRIDEGSESRASRRHQGEVVSGEEQEAASQQHVQIDDVEDYVLRRDQSVRRGR